MVERVVDVDEVEGPIPSAPTMEKSEIEKIERMGPEEIMDELEGKIIPKGILDVVGKVTEHPDIYYIETGKDDSFALVKRRGDDIIIYETDDPNEVVRLKHYGIEK